MSDTLAKEHVVSPRFLKAQPSVERGIDSRRRGCQALHSSLSTGKPQYGIRVDRPKAGRPAGRFDDQYQPPDDMPAGW